MPESIQGIASANAKIPLPVPVTSGGNEKTQQAISQNSKAGDVLTASIDQSGTYSTKNTGAAMVMAASTTAKVAMEINSVTNQVISSMKKLPAPIDLTAVTEVKNEIRAGTYIYDSAKVVDALQKAYHDMI